LLLIVVWLRGVQLNNEANKDEWVSQLILMLQSENESPDVILLDVRLGDDSGLEVFHDLRRLDPRSLIIFITGHGTTDTAIEAMKLGAYD